MRTAVAVSAAVLLACRPQTAKTTGTSAQAATDTLRGILVLEGSDPFPIVAMRTSEGRVLLESTSTEMLKLTQLDLWLSGRRTSADRFVVMGYRVRGANGVRAWDGVLKGTPTGFRLELDNGSAHDIRGASADLSRFVGSRVWLTENPDGTIREYGILK